ARRRLRQHRGCTRPYRSRGAQGGARNLRAAGRSRGDFAKTSETAAGGPDPQDRSGESPVRRADALEGSSRRVPGFLCAQEGLSLKFALAALICLTTGAAAQTASPVELRILAINDFHGNLRPPPGGIRIGDPADKAAKIAVPAGGTEHMATLVKALREGRKNHVFVAAGDLIGASPFLSAMFHDEPTVES